MHTSHQSAFTVAEVLIAITILLTATFAIYSAIGTTTNVARAGREQAMVMQDLENRMEIIQASDWNFIPGYQGDVYDVTGVNPSAGAVGVIGVQVERWDAGGGAYSAVTPGYLAQPHDLFRVTLTATWDSIVGQNSETIEFHLANRGE